MAFRASPVNLGAYRLPLTSKMGNKDFYKGTGPVPGLGPKAQGRHSPRSKAPYILEDRRMRVFMVPDIPTDTELRPFVSRAVKYNTYQDNAYANPGKWPVAATKDPELHRKRRGLYSPRGFDGHYYLQLAQWQQQVQAQGAEASGNAVNKIRQMGRKAWDKL